MAYTYMYTSTHSAFMFIEYPISIHEELWTSLSNFLWKSGVYQKNGRKQTMPLCLKKQKGDTWKSDHIYKNIKSPHLKCIYFKGVCVYAMNESSACTINTSFLNKLTVYKD